MIVALILTLSAIACISALLIVNKAGETDNICEYGYPEE